MYTLAGMFLCLFYIALTASGVLFALYVIVPCAYRRHNTRYSRKGR